MKRYDRAYFDRWYRDSRTRVQTGGELRRKASMLIAVVEHLLARPVRSVLDVGCGEGRWEPVLRRIRPGIRYLGLDGSDYAVRRFGKRRNLRLGTFEHVGGIAAPGPYDLIVCSDVLHYLGAAELRKGLSQLGDLLGGVAYLEILTAADPVSGDLREWRRRSPAFYLRRFREAGLVPCGLHCYIGEARASELARLELPGLPS